MVNSLHKLMPTKKDLPLDLKERYYIDSGSMSLNALVSGTIHGGIASGQVMGICGESATGKTFISANAVRSFLNEHKDNIALWIDTEGIDHQGLFKAMDIDADRVEVIETQIIEDITITLNKVFNAIERGEVSNRVIIVLDSLGMLMSSKTFSDIENEDIKADVGNTARVKGQLMRVIGSRVKTLNLLCIITNHLYNNVGGYGASKKESGGEVWKYVAGQRIWITKKKDIDKDKMVNGIIVNAMTEKSRITKQYQSVDTYIDFSSGLNRTAGIMDIATKLGILKKNGAWYTIGDKKFQSKAFQADPFSILTDDVLSQIDKGCEEMFKYGADLDD